MVENPDTQAERRGRAGGGVAIVSSSGRQAVFRRVLLLGNAGLEGGRLSAGGWVGTVVGARSTTVTTTAAAVAVAVAANAGGRYPRPVVAGCRQLLGIAHK